MTGGRSIAIFLVRVYQVVFSPLKGMLFGAGACCRFTPSCSCYAIEAFRAHGLFRGIVLTGRRLLRCHPWAGAGYDPVPEVPLWSAAAERSGDAALDLRTSGPASAPESKAVSSDRTPKVSLAAFS